jgi:hypothetical protein
MALPIRKRSFDELMVEFPYLTTKGIADYEWWPVPKDSDHTFVYCRAWLYSVQARVERCAAWLEAHIAPTKTVNRGWGMGSYQLKHVYEKRDPDGYITEGEFIAAALMAGFLVQETGRYGFKARFGMSKRSWTALPKVERTGFVYEPRQPRL